jgi:hypothetical protein
VAVVAAVIGFVVAWPRTPAPLQRPAAVTALHKTDKSVTLKWTTEGPQPTTYAIVQDGKQVASVPGSQTSYTATGLLAAAAYQFSVVGVRGTSRSAASTPILASTVPPPVPPLSDAIFYWTGTAHYTETAGSDSFWQKNGAKWSDGWSVTANCLTHSCAKADLDGSMDGVSFDVTLHRSGSTYTGTTPINDFWISCGNRNDFSPSSLSVTLTATKEGYGEHAYYVTGFTGLMTWTVPYDPNGGCFASRYVMSVSGSAPAP